MVTTSQIRARDLWCVVPIYGCELKFKKGAQVARRVRNIHFALGNYIIAQPQYVRQSERLTKFAKR